MVTRSIVFGSALLVVGLAGAQTVSPDSIDIPTGWQMVATSTDVLLKPHDLAPGTDASVEFEAPLQLGTNTLDALRSLLTSDLAGYQSGPIDALRNPLGSTFLVTLAHGPQEGLAMLVATRPEGGYGRMSYRASDTPTFQKYLPIVSKIARKWMGETGPASGSWTSPDGQTHASGSASGTGDNVTNNVTGDAQNGSASVTSSSSSSSSSSQSNHDSKSSSQSNHDSMNRSDHQSNSSQMQNSDSKRSSDQKQNSNQSSQRNQMVAFDPGSREFKLVGAGPNQNQLPTGNFRLRGGNLSLPLGLTDGDIEVWIGGNGQVVLKSGKKALMGHYLQSPDGPMIELAGENAMRLNLSMIAGPTPRLALGGILLDPAK